MIKDRVSVAGKVVVVLTDTRDGSQRVYESKNIVTDAGDLYYAQRGVDATPTNFTSGATFDGVVELANGASAAPAKGNDRSDLAGIIGSTQKAMTATYPKVNDVDARNTGAGVDVVTYLAEYVGSDFNATGIADVIITNPTPGASEPVLMHAEFAAPFDKTANDTLAIFINHTMAGV